ncbi:hypothetical protein BBK36DRAFT_1168461 [Trichoderma citrinoviride]|uniref:Uncharacterized protein n=1 Tax=Trichoderma citrinoviride TaxID=58853 RepID=A0A2T4BC95_9HYPO|nr:hypothetical protein BBK36DRAFT_1168461 [Trichoderma citrinoviride]PTB66947.1 hypothetical protein BBK36DRAFT_1168461 [Trichoderma citrinoviride]
MTSFGNVRCGEVPSLHALTVSPNVLGSHTIPPTATLVRYITVPPTGPDVYVMEVASAPNVQFLFNFWRPRAALDCLTADLRDTPAGRAAAMGSFTEACRTSDYHGTVPELHALRLFPSLLRPNTIPDNATLRREIKISSTSPTMHVHETASIGDELYIFFYPWTSRGFGYLFREMSPSNDRSYLDLVRAALDNPTGFMNLQGVTVLRESRNMMAYHVASCYFTKENLEDDYAASSSQVLPTAP